MGISDRIPDLSDKELESLHANALRLAASGSTQQRQQAEELLPLLGAALEERKATKTATLKTKRAAAKPKSKKAEPSA